MPEQLGYNGPDGMTMGSSSSETISFYGTTPVAQYQDAGAASTYATYQQSTGSASTWGFATSTALISFISQVSTLTVAMRNVGLIA